MELADGDSYDVLGHKMVCLDTPGHTLGHITLLFPDNKALFCGDTLFIMGCGRMFEGNPPVSFVGGWHACSDIHRVPALHMRHLAILHASNTQSPSLRPPCAGCQLLFPPTLSFAPHPVPSLLPQMFWNSLSKFLALDPDTHVYCAHEYTASNARFALSIDPDNPALKERAKNIQASGVSNRGRLMRGRLLLVL